MQLRQFIQPMAAALLSLAAAAASAAPTLIGSTLDFLRAYPDTSTQFGVAIPSTTVVAGASDSVNWTGLSPSSPVLTTIDPEADSISFVFPLLAVLTGASPGIFDGFVISGFDADIASVSLLSNTTSYIVELSHGLRSIAIDLTGASVPTSSFVIGVTLADAPSAVPAPGTLALCGTALTLLAMRRRRQPAVSP